MNCRCRLARASEVHGLAALVRAHRSSAGDLQWRGGARFEVEWRSRTADVEDTIPISRSGWCLLRAWSDKAEHPVLDMYPYATTSPIYVTVAGSHPRPTEDAAYFIAWIDRMIDAAKSNQDWNTEAEKTAVLEMLSSARKVYAEK